MLSLENGFADSDVVDFSNLQRQVIHGTKDVGRSKCKSARERIRDINPNVQVDIYETYFTSENARKIAALADGKHHDWNSIIAHQSNG